MPEVLCPAPLATLRLTPWRQSLIDRGWMKQVLVDGLRMTYVDHGVGPVVGLMHGHGGSAFDWRHLFAPLAAAGYRVVAPDMIGSGYSDKPDTDYTVHAQAERMASFWRALRLEQMVLGGNSYGGGISLVLAQRHPALARALVLLNPICYRHPLPGYLKILTFPWLAAVALHSIPKFRSVKHALRAGYFNAKAIVDADVAEYAHELGLPGSAMALVRMIRDIIPPDLDAFEAGMARIEQPALILWGQHDRVLRPHLAERLHHDLRASRLLLLDQCGHQPNQEQPQATVAAVLGFLTELDRSRVPVR